jgi:hypothetical protein
MSLSRRAQTIMEYVLLISLVTAAVVTMLPGIRRGTQSLMKTAADQIGDQAGAEQDFNDVTVGYLADSSTTAKSLVNNFKQQEWGWIKQDVKETSETSMSSITNAGWSQE